MENEGLGISLTDRQRKAVETVIIPKRRQLESAFLGKCSPRSAIKMKCHDCCGFEDFQVRIKECKTDICPLWKFRPYQ